MMLSISIRGSGLASGGGSGSGCFGCGGGVSRLGPEPDLPAPRSFAELESPAVEDLGWNMAESVV